MCQGLAKFTQPRPSPDHYAAFVFPDPPTIPRDDNEDDDGTTDIYDPRLVWIRSIYNNDKGYFESDEDEIKTAMGYPNDPIKKDTEHVDRKGKFIRAWRHNAAGLMGLVWNSNIMTIDDECYWRGPALVQTGFAGEILEPLEMRDMGAGDMNDLVAFCEFRGRAMSDKFD
ncbi:hypothetical protein Vi05172_g2148 [Venturia inaequalis]|uniref:Uncharacterized protein n=1 Tax=Venturia inaequalis TaxID=5025 RepID=A0A8H3ZGQ4_VENIN|nr:hypothetical protein EG327_011724 [Venturia inaequalis]RDI87851.1 hypothetical protein Vi05172_g2148 [Venturia inaequalis]